MTCKGKALILEFLLVGLVWLAPPVQGQVPDSLRSIPDTLYSLHTYPGDPSASYFMDINALDIHFKQDERSIVAVLNYYVRLKVFDATDADASIVSIPYNFKDGLEEVKNIEGRNHLSPDSVVVLDENDVRTIELNSRYKVKQFTLPGVENGSVLEYSYTIKRRYIEELPDFFLTHEAPTRLARIRIHYPDYLRYRSITEHFEDTLEHKISRIDTSSVPKIFTIPRPQPLVIEQWKARNLPAVKNENYISSLSNYRAKIKFQLSEFGRPRQILENSWEYIVAKIRREQNPFHVIEQNNSAEAIGESIASVKENPEAVQDSIFKYINTRMQFDGNRMSFSQTMDTTVLNGHPADQAAVNQTLIAMLRGAGIQAWPVLISTREFGRIDKGFPSLLQFNGLLAYSEINGKTYFLDGSFSHSQPNLIPVESFNNTGMKLSQDNFEWIDISPDQSLFSIDISVQAHLEPDGGLSGKVMAKLKGYPIQKIRESHAIGSSSEEIFKNTLLDGYLNVSVSNVKIADVYRFDAPISLSGSFRIEDYAVSFQDGLDFRPLIIGYQQNNPFGQSKRSLPVTLDAPESLHLSYEVSFPKNFKFPDGFQDRSIKMQGASLQEYYDSDGDKVAYEFNINISRKNFEANLYPQFLEIYERWVDLSTIKWHIQRNS